MRCVVCVENDQRSKLYVGGSTTTCLGWQSYYDEDGHYHTHNPNMQHISYTCSNGHGFYTSSEQPCPCTHCDFGRGESSVRGAITITKAD